jgi:hypothetical protein
MGGMKRVLFVVSIVLVALGVTTPAAWAKEGVKATLATQFPLNAKPGARIHVRWTLWYPAQSGKRQPFGGSGVFIRLRSASGDLSTTTTATFQAGGTYAATVPVPDGGLGGIQIGIHGETVGSTSGPADLLFPITNNPFRGQSIVLPAGAASSPTPWLRDLLMIATAIAAAVGGVFLITRLRPTAQSGHHLG